MKQRLFILLLIICLILSAGCGSMASDDENKIILTTGFEDNELFFIGDSKCYVPEARLYIKNLATGYEKTYGDELMELTVQDETIQDRLTSLALSRLAEVKALGLLAADMDITLDSREMSRCDQAAERYFSSLSEGDVADMSIDRSIVLSMYEDYALADKVYDSITDEINPEISDDEARIITIQRILITGDDEAEALQKANAVYAMLSAGASFDSLADDYNDAPQSKYSFSKDTDEFSEEFVSACFDMARDEISTPMITDEGVSIVKCLSTYDMEQTDINKALIVEKRKREAFDKVYEAFVGDLYTGFNSSLWEEQMLTSRRLDAKETFFEVYDDIFNTPGSA